ncbi:MAG: hypothetical protein CMJ75_14625 [Planctomycetaceae bacterium]|nr:hypothetical protein [Planctomycetaceae bacterium]
MRLFRVVFRLLQAGFCLQQQLVPQRCFGPAIICWGVVFRHCLVLLCGHRAVDTMFVVMVRLLRSESAFADRSSEFEDDYLFDLEKGAQCDDESTQLAQQLACRFRCECIGHTW